MTTCEDVSLIGLARSSIQDLTPYKPGKPAEELQREFGLSNVIKLASNENPLGPSAAVTAAITNNLASLARYPDGSAYLLRQALARFHDIDKQCITVGNGSNDILEILARIFLGPENNAVFSQHAFVVYSLATKVTGAQAKVAPAHDGALGPAYGHDLTAMAARVDHNTRVVFIANPNNPTGTYLSHSALIEFITSIRKDIIIIVDEAYFEYVDQPDYRSTIESIAIHPNLVVTRTFSKAYGLAGLRCGYAIANPEIINLIDRVRQPFNVNSLAQIAAVAALQDQQHITDSCQANRAGMQQLIAGFTALGLHYIPASANFVCVDVGQSTGDCIYQALLKHGVIVRPITNDGLPNFLRVTIGLEHENTRFLQALAGELPQ